MSAHQRNHRRGIWGRVRVAVRLLLGSYLIAFVLGPFLYVSAVGAQCSTWAGRSVPSFEVDGAAVLAKAGETGTIEVPVLPGGVAGMAFAGRTFTVDGAGAEVILHEAVHHLQVERDGVLPYSLRYVKEWVKGVYHGCGPHDAYRYVSYEIQARRASDRFPRAVYAAAGRAQDAESFAAGLDLLNETGGIAEFLRVEGEQGGEEGDAGEFQAWSGWVRVVGGKR